jgi:hypothetical protein
LIFLFLVLIDQYEVQMVRPPPGLNPEMAPRRSGNPCHWHHVLHGTDALISYPNGKYLTLYLIPAPIYAWENGIVLNTLIPSRK